MINARVLLVLVLLKVTSRGAGQHPTSGTPLNILSLLPYPDPAAQPSWSEGPTLTIAAQIAVGLYINNRSDILPGYKVELVVGDSGCNLISKAAIATKSVILSPDKPVAGIVGPAWVLDLSLVSSPAHFPGPDRACERTHSRITAALQQDQILECVWDVGLE